MKLVMTLCVKNEADIVRENIEFHLNAGVDFIIATDNRSNDATEGILKEYERAGVLRYIYAPSPFFNQRDSVTKMARMAYFDYDADWVINNDVDEFWWTPDGNLKNAIKRYCERRPTDGLTVNRIDFVSDQSDETQQPMAFYQHMIRRRLQSTNALGQPLPAKLMHRADPSVKVFSGNHDVNGKLIKNKVQVDDREIVIFHFPLRSFYSLIRKATKDYQSRKKSIFFSGVDNTYSEYHRLYQKGKLRTYYDHYCGVEESDDANLVQDYRFKDHMKKIMPSPVLNVAPQGQHSLIKKIKKVWLMSVSHLSEYSLFFLKKKWYQLKRQK